MSGVSLSAEALKHIEWAHDVQGGEGTTDRTVTDTALLAQVYATLALAEQQRIANIIALAELETQGSTDNGMIDALFTDTGKNWRASPGDAWAGVRTVRPEVRNQLGLA